LLPLKDTILPSKVTCIVPTSQNDVHKLVTLHLLAFHLASRMILQGVLRKFVHCDRIEADLPSTSLQRNIFPQGKLHGTLHAHPSTCLPKIAAPFCAISLLFAMVQHEHAETGSLSESKLTVVKRFQFGHTRLVMLIC
jgi:hypothetical protein